VASTSIVVGSALFLAFWDLDNWMLVGSALLLIGLAMSRPSRATVNQLDSLSPR
jgi:hypothetical protein